MSAPAPTPVKQSQRSQADLWQNLIAIKRISFVFVFVFVLVVIKNEYVKSDVESVLFFETQSCFATFFVLAWVVHYCTSSRKATTL
jgi:putative effector of murein hydrolase LrgA (UPF0299 family)